MVADLLPVYGDSFLRHVLALDGGASDLNTINLTERQVQVCALLRQLLATAPHDEHGFGRFSALGNLARWQDESNSSLVNALRLHAGGDLPQIPDTDDELLKALFALARDAWPSFLIPPPRAMPATFWASSSVAVFSHPETLSAARHFLTDASLRNLFPEAPSGAALAELDQEGLVAISSHWMGTAGRGGSQQLISLLGILISNARLAALMDDGDDSWDGLVRALPQVVTSLRRLSTGDVVDVPCLIAFHGAALTGAASIELPNGRLIEPRPHDRDYLLPESETATAIFVTSYPLRILDIRVWRPGETPAGGTANFEIVGSAQQSFQRGIDLTRLAVLLASPEGARWALSESARVVLDPTSPGGVSSWTGRKYGVGHGELDQAAGKSINDWWSTLQREHRESLDIAMKRVLDAAGNRSDPIDGFVDAVVAWENCFGTNTETTFRVTGAIAALLVTASGDERLAQQRKLKRIYDKRSKVVHGALQPSPQDATSLRDEALDTAITCLRRLYRERTDLLPLKSEERSLRLLLGAAEE